MADVTIKLFGVYRTDTQISTTKIEAGKITDVFSAINKMAEEKFAEKLKENPGLVKPDEIKFKDAVVYVNGEKCTKKGRALHSNDEIWIMSPASGG